MPYRKFSDYLIEKYHEKVYKISLNIKCSCPNRDGTKDNKGCIFCGETGAGFETLGNSVPIKEQLSKNIDYIGKKYNAEKFIAYFQSYSSTYLPLDTFQYNINQAIDDRILAVYISTRPDCLTDEQCLFLKNIKEKHHIDIVIELGLQSTHNQTLLYLNRHHTYEDFTDCVAMIKKHGLEVCVHMINDLPEESLEHVIENAKRLSKLKVDQVKCHSLYVLKNTVLGNRYEKGEIRLLTLDDFIERTISFLEYLDKTIVIQRLIGRAPKEETLFCNYGRNWRYIVDKIEADMLKNNRLQGSKSQVF
ncbi:MAG: TIGR01212 family radical SAM protein [Clostridia bacterium]|nr:TIGR01212 family radical SAM protein [Clostridia bacterium]